MLTLLMEARALTDDWRYPHIGEFLFNFYMVAIHLDPRQHIRLWHADGRLAGFAVLGEDPNFDFQVRPEYEWRGIEEEAMAWADALTAELRARDPQTWGGKMVSGARQDNPRRRAFLEAHGFQVGGPFSEVNMILRLDGEIPAPRAPAGFELREVVEADAAAHAEICRSVWEPWSVGKIKAEDYAYFMTLTGYDRGLDIVTTAPDGLIVSYVTGWTDPLNRIGDLGPVGAREEYRRRGLTRAAQLECLRRLRTRGMQRVCISTGESNTPARALYESVGFEIVNRYIEYVR